MFEQFRAWLAAVGYPGERLIPRSYGSFGEYARAIGQRELDVFLLGWTLAVVRVFAGLPDTAPDSRAKRVSGS